MSQRPFPITAVGVIGAIAALVAIALLVTNAPWIVPPTTAQRAVGLGAVAATASGLYGMWRMRRWGVILIALLFGGRVIYGLVRPGNWGLVAMSGPVLLLLLGAIYWREMT